MKSLKELLSEFEISKVRLAKYLGVSRQMLYNYLADDGLDKWPNEKAVKLFNLLGVKDEKELFKLKPNSEQLMEIDEKLKNCDKEESNKIKPFDLKGLNKKEQDVLTNIINLLTEKMINDKKKTRDTYHTYRYLYYFLQSMDTTRELKYMLGYIAKSLRFIEPNEYAFNEEKQFIFESIMYSAMTLYNSGSASKTKIAETHKRFVQELEQKKEEFLSRTQELNTAKIQALKELGYTDINNNNAKEVLDKIAEIESRKV